MFLIIIPHFKMTRELNPPQPITGNIPYMMFIPKFVVDDQGAHFVWVPNPFFVHE